MTSAPVLSWLPADPGWRARVRGWGASGEPNWNDAVALASVRMDFIQTNALDETVRRAFAAALPEGLGIAPIRLAILGSSTLSHLHAGIRLGGLRRRLWVTTYEPAYGQYWQELTDPGSGLHTFKPTAILFAFDAVHLTQGVHAALSAQDVDALLTEKTEHLRECWRLARADLQCRVLQQTLLSIQPAVLGSNEQRLPGSRHNLVARLNGTLRKLADAENVDLVAVDVRAAQDGTVAWHDPSLWHRSKQEISPAAAPVYGDLVSRVLGAQQGKSAKCLVLDLDDTLWGGVVGEVGVDGLVLGQGSAVGEAFLAVQEYAKELSRRGVILAVCSKNDEPNALEPFERHPDMVLRRADIASFVANWNDKASNLRMIAKELNLGLDALVFVDDNPAERDLVRRELPMVAVPEIPDEPGLVPQLLADAGYFESVAITEDDRVRAEQYQANRAREVLKSSSTDLPSYLRSLQMRLLWRGFDRLGLTRTVQLINKTNQFNLTTRRYDENDVAKVMADGRCFGLQLRLLDRFGDNGIIGIVIGKMQENADLLIDTWLMSCRVLGRQVEAATLDIVAAQARALGATRLIGEYRPTAKNGMVRDHYDRLGFTPLSTAADGARLSALILAEHRKSETFIEIKESV